MDAQCVLKGEAVRKERGSKEVVFYGLKSGIKWPFGYTKGIVGYNTDIFLFIFENNGKGKSSEI